MSSIPLAAYGCASDDGTASDPLGGGDGLLGDEDCDHGHDDGGDGDGVSVDLMADLHIEVVGTGLYLGLDPVCDLDLSGEFHVDVDATASYHDDDGGDDATSLWSVVEVSSDATIETGDGCSCDGLSIDAMASVDISASLDATTESCDLACDAAADADAVAACSDDECRADVRADAHASCMLTCDQAGNTLVATTTLSADAMASVSLDGDDNFDALADLELDLDFDQVVHADGSVTDL